MRARWTFSRARVKSTRRKSSPASPEGEEVTVYRQGRFVGLVPRPRTCPPPGAWGRAFKLTKLAGAVLAGATPGTRCCSASTAPPGPATRTSESTCTAWKRPSGATHRRLGRQMDLFHFQDEAVGAVFWHEKGWTLFRTLVEYMRRRQDAAGLPGGPIPPN